MEVSEDIDGSFGGFQPEMFALGACSKTEWVTIRRRRS
jgi:hypothetical protein